MARPGLTKHRKFLALCDLLNLPDAYVLGLLEMMWSGCYEAGDDRLGTRALVERSARWPGKKGRFAEAVIAAGFVDEEGDECRVHDLLDHAPKYVADRMRREAVRREQGKTLREVRQEAGRKGFASLKASLSANGAQLPGKQESLAQHVTGTPAPAPAPIKTPCSPPPDEPRNGAADRALRLEFREDFDLWASTLPGGGKRVVPTEDRWRKYAARRKDSTREEVQQALQGWKYDPWEGRAQQNDFAILLRNRAQVEKFSALYVEHQPRPAPARKDGDVHRVTGQVWSTAAGGWVGAGGWVPIPGRGGVQ